MAGKQYPYAVVENKRIEQKKKVGQPAKKKNLMQRINWRKFIVFSIALLLVGKFVSGFFTIFDLKDQQALLQEELNSVRSIEAELTGKIQYLESDEAVERLAREKLGLVKPGEVIVVRAEDKK